jgi:glutamate N-acetyltransferase / amino-acid N-acetyltransferase
VSAYMRRSEIRLKVDLGIGRARDRVLTCDLTKEYIVINAGYRS